jgi:hypothetical protein
MNTQKNKLAVKDLCGAFDRGNIAAMRALIAEDVIWRLPGEVRTRLLHV